jgi:hypothetical protein
MTLGIALIAIASVALDMTTPPIVGLNRLERLLETWPLLEPEVEARWFSGFDRTGGNDDGFTGQFTTLYVDENGENVIFDVEQPGCLYTLSFTSDRGGFAPLNWGKIRFYFDNEKTPRFEMEANELYSGKKPPFVSPLVVNNHISTGGFVCYLPMPFAERLKITTERRVGFYISYYQVYPHGTKIKSFTGRESRAKVAEIWEKALEGTLVPLPGGRKEAGVERGGRMEWSKSGSGVITRVALVCEKGVTERLLREGTITCEFDDGEKFRVPVGPFFGLCLGPAPVRGLATYAGRRKLVSIIPMPFWEKASITVEAPEPVSLEVSIAPQKYERGKAGYLQVMYNEEFPTKKGRDFVHGAPKAAGKVIGMVRGIEPGSADNKWWWEGDLRVTTDGARSPAMHGTGHEDDFLGGWSNQFLSRPFTLPMHGEPYVKILERGQIWNGDCSLYRFFVGVPFGAGIQWSTEHGTENEGNYNYSGALFYYKGGPVYKKTDEFVVPDRDSQAAHNAKRQSVSDPEELTSQFEGREYKKDVTATVVSSLGKMEFDVKLNPRNQGVKLRRMFDQFHGRQRARVFVDGELVGIWFTVEENQHRRWSERDFFIPAGFTSGKSKVRITIDPPASSPLWSHVKYTVFSLVDGG